MSLSNINFDNIRVNEHQDYFIEFKFYPPSSMDSASEDEISKWRHDQKVLYFLNKRVKNYLINELEWIIKIYVPKYVSKLLII